MFQSPTVSHVGGVHVDCYHVGFVYDVDQNVGEILLAEEWAEPAPFDKIIPFHPPTPIDVK
jgi:hypothetical protein